MRPPPPPFPGTKGHADHRDGDFRCASVAVGDPTESVVEWGYVRASDGASGPHPQVWARHRAALDRSLILGLGLRTEPADRPVHPRIRDLRFPRSAPHRSHHRPVSMFHVP
ncbi:hypothetical protein CSOJ01_09249 [Colletotrichum sojae]|uniref:Uncharacterized protein n=1 Tax=Colletotrichum sojae TaxID=2175907 RepID=A0A8H6MRT2_9PEZI|nr:hypothetical protein CSOJ01_09249 [Colletotrichum sojae]